MSSLADKYPDLLKEWDYNLNKGLDPTTIPISSNKKVSWVCLKNPEHIWQTSIAHRTAGTKCPYCSNQKIQPSNSLAATNPDLAKEWHPKLNGDLTPSQVAGGSDKKVWWLCSTHDDHIYQAKISSRNRGAICSVCAGRVVVYSNSLKKLFPKIADEWHKTLNKKLPTAYTAGSNTMALWQCSVNPKHIWKSKICNRTLNNRGCPYCNRRQADDTTNFSFLFPELLKEWDFEKNKISPDSILSNAAKKIWWICNKNPKHKWQAILYSRTRHKYGCPYCTGRFADEETNITVTHPKLLKEWNYEKNKKLPTEYKSGSNQKVWWKCDKGVDHIWLTSINNRTNGKNCPVCAGQKVVDSTRLTTTHPKIAAQWHPKLNGNLKPENFSSGSTKIIHWLCNKNKIHDWKTTIRSLAIQKTGCPYCYLTPQSKEELIILFELKTIFKEIKIENFKLRHHNRIYSFDIFIPSLNLLIEYDGSHWHKGKQIADSQKINIANENGFHIFRIRQSPLKKLSEKDIIVPQKFHSKTYPDIILSHIKKLFSIELNSKKQNQIENYLQKKTTVGDKNLEKYIDHLLKQKSNKG